MTFSRLYTSSMTKLRLTVSEKRNKLSVKGCHFEQSEKNSILSRVKFSIAALRCKQVGVSRVQTRKSQRDWLSFSLQPGGQRPAGLEQPCTRCIKLAAKNSNKWKISKLLARVGICEVAKIEYIDKSSAVAEMGDRGHNRHGPKRWGLCARFSQSWDAV